MKQTVFKGCGTALITPFTPDGKHVDKNGFQRFLEFQIKNGADALIVAGTTGEAPTLTADEKREIFALAVTEAGGKIPVIAGTGSNNTEEAVRKANAAEKEGVDGLLIVTPYYNKCTQTGLIEHYFYIADRVSTPIIVYDVPSRTGVSVTPETYRALAEHKNIVAVKEADTDITKFIKALSLCKGDLDFYSGNDDLTGTMMSLGAKGVISVASNIIPLEMHQMCELFLNGENVRGAEMNIRLSELMNLLFCEVNPIPIKAAVSMLREQELSPAVRLPLTGITAKNRQRIKDEMTRSGII